MAATFHVNPDTGRVGKCSATAGQCPFGGAELHSSTPEQAEALYARKVEADFDPETNAFGTFKKTVDGDVRAVTDEDYQARSMASREETAARSTAEKKLSAYNALRAQHYNLNGTVKDSISQEVYEELGRLGQETLDASEAHWQVAWRERQGKGHEPVLDSLSQFTRDVRWHQFKAEDTKLRNKLVKSQEWQKAEWAYKVAVRNARGY